MKRKNLWKRTMSLVLAIVLVLGLSVGCAQGDDKESSKSGTTQSAETTKGADTTQGAGEQTTEDAGPQLLEGGMTYSSGLPITKEKIELDVYIMKAAYLPDAETTEVWDYIEEKTNIRLNVKTLADSEKIALTFTSREYPDLYMYVNIKSNQLNDAAEAGDLVEIGPLLEEYAPTYYEFYQENEIIQKQSLATDGKQYSLCYADFAPWEKGYRDSWCINGKWLDELGLELPKTTEEFKNVLAAFKNNAGKGTIPENVIPYHFMFDSYVGGQFDIYGAFGVYCPTADYLIVEDGKVKLQAVNPELKEPLKYLNDLYELGLIAPEAFTDNSSAFNARVAVAEGQSTVQVGAYTAYFGGDPYVGGEALDSGDGKGLMRSQSMASTLFHNGIITKENEYPIATLRLMEWLASDPEALMTLVYGMENVFWERNGDKYQTITLTADEAAELTGQKGINNLFVGLRDFDFYETYWFDATREQDGRSYRYYNLYEGKTTSQDLFYVGGTLSADDTSEMNLLATDLATCRKAWLADFITGRKDIDAEWDNYVKEMEKLGLDRYMELRQQAYDLLH